MPITVTLEGEDEARVSELVDRAVFGSALEAVQGALKLAEAAFADGQGPSADDQLPPAQPK